MRYSRIFIIILCVAVAFLVAGYALFSPRQTPDIKNYPSQGSDIIAFGDSLMSGYGSTKGHDFVSDLSVQIGAPIVNLGHNGDTTEDGLARISELDRYHPKVVLVLLGGNDFLKGVSQHTTFDNLSKIIAHVQSQGGVVLLLGIRGGILSDPYAAQFKKLSETYQTAYIPDVLDGLLGDKEYMSDEVHPNDAGYAKIAARVAPVLIPLLH